MENNKVGYIIILLGSVIGAVVYMFNTALIRIVTTSCEHGASCPMFGAIELQTNIGILLTAVIVGVGIYLTFFEKFISVETEKTKSNKRSEKISNLNDDEKAVIEKIEEEDGTIFQSKIVESLGFPKAKVTRIIDRLEGKGLVERRRRGMTNVVVLKNK